MVVVEEMIQAHDMLDERGNKKRVPQSVHGQAIQIR